ncbi:SGNH/GDSL hydrolase family protein [Glaciihabitans sp. dw_435]|uniref:SGNH/GDSL hydrolase family protein n=1 Tax=Glaciihabitans sp. dw_435 TaxID=2720081 RepID=UPI001BD2D05D|nr:SGNH/GDSL hydrolase family protein [Glaciihabitans sp. dw_435]
MSDAPTIDPRWSLVVAALQAPVLLAQARRMRRVIPRLPDAAQPWTGASATDAPASSKVTPLRILVLGDSTAAGVGADTQDDALPGHLARALTADSGRPYTWRAIGENGATSWDIAHRFIGPATLDRYDFIFLSIGANDALGLRTRGAFRRDIRTILRRLRAASPTATILVSSLPAFFRFEALPDPLRRTLYLHSMSLENAARAVVEQEPGVRMSPPPPPYTAGFFASDRFHPSSSGYRDWAHFALEDAGIIPPAATTATAAAQPAATTAPAAAATPAAHGTPGAATTLGTPADDGAVA